MSKRTVYHVTPKGGDWSVKKVGAERASASTATKQEAIQRAVDLAKTAGGPAQVRIHNLDGAIGSERTYGKDPEKYRG